MSAWFAVIVLIALSVGTQAQYSFSVTEGMPNGTPSRDELQQLIKGELNDGKKRLAQNFLTTELRNRDSIDVTPAFTWKLGTIKGSAASTFRSFNQSFILSGKILYRLIEGPGQSNYNTEQVAKFPEFLGDIAFMESVEWEGLLYLVAAYKEGLLQLFTVAQTNEVILRQSIECHGTPTDAEFFMQDEKLFLIVSAKNGSAFVPVVVYRWYGTQLDEENRHLLIGASAVSTFPFRESVVITVAVDATESRTAGLEIFVRTGNKWQLVQFLPTSQPSALQHYTFHSENYLLVSTVQGPSIICWWAGTEMIIWDTLKSVESIRSIGVGYLKGETLILLAEKTRIKVYRPTAASFQFITEHEFSSSVQSASFYSKDDSISLLAITESNGQMIPNVLELQVVFKAATINHIPQGLDDPLLKCISSLEYKIKSQDIMLQDILSERSKLMILSNVGNFKGKLVVKKLVPNVAVVQRVNLTKEDSTTMILTRSELEEGIEKARGLAFRLADSLKNIVFKSSPSSLSGRLTTTKLYSSNINMESVYISKLNGVDFDPSKFLMYNKDQRLTGKITAETINVDSLHVSSLNHFKIEDMLRKSVDHQIISGLQLVDHIKARKVVIENDQIPVNGISMSRIITSKSREVIPVTGTKTFAGLDLQQLAVGLLNNVNFTQWIASLQQPNLPMPMPPTYPGAMTYKSNGDLRIHNLTVNGRINGVPINDLLHTLFLKGMSQTIKGDIHYRSQLNLQSLDALQVNEIPTSSLLTRTTHQVIKGLAVDSLSATDIIVGSLNGLKLSRDAAYLNSPFSVSTPVTFKSLESHELVLPPKASIAGQEVGRRLLNEPKIIYKGTVRVEGSLKLMDVKLDEVKVFLGDKLIDFHDLRLNYWTKSSDQEIKKILQSSNELSIQNLAINTINGHNIEDFVSLSSTKNLKGTWHFPPSTTVDGDLVHEPSALQSPVVLKELSSTIVKTSGEYVVSGSKIFLGGLSVNHLMAEYLDNRIVADLLGAKNTQGPAYQEIWVGGNLHVHSDISVGSVNKVNLCDRLSKALLIDRPGRIPSATISAVSATYINVNTINGVPFNLIGDPNHKTVPRVHRVTLKGNVFVPSFINVQSVNNKFVKKDYIERVVDKSKDAIIHGRKTFASQLSVEGSFDALDYNGIKLKNLFENVLSKTKDQLISARIRMKDIVASELKASLVNNIDVGNLLSSELMSRQHIEGDLLLTNDVDVIGHLYTATFEKTCDLNLVAKRLQTLDGRHWSSLLVNGNLDWTEDLHQRIAGLGYFLGSAVTINSNQVISGEVAFDYTASVDNFNSHKHINDIDFESIARDSLRKSLPDQVINSKKIFSTRLSTTTMHIMGNVAAKTVAGVNILKFNSSLVRVYGDQIVNGNKRFLQGFTADLLKVDTVNGLVPSEVACYDQPLLPPLHFLGPLEVKTDLSFNSVNDFKLDELLAERVTLDSSQQINGHINFIRDVTVEGEMVAPRINNLDIADIVLRDSLIEQEIRGKKHFAQNVRVDGPMEVDQLWNVDLRVAYSAALFKDENATIFGDLILGNIATLNANLDVIDTVNDMKMSDLARMLNSRYFRSLEGVQSIARTIQETNSLLTARGDLSELLYLELVADAAVSFTNTYRAIERMSDGSESFIDVYGWASNVHCGLPATCMCPAQYTVHASSEGQLRTTWSTGLKQNSTQRSFTFHLKDPHVTVIVKTNTVSRDTRCRLDGADRLNEVTLISWVEMGSNNELKEFSVNIDSKPILGYVSDVKTIVVNGHVYVVLGIYYNPYLDTTNLNSVVVYIDRTTQRARIVAEFPTQGVLSLDVFSTTAGHHLVVGNSFDSSKQSTKVSLDIYRFSPRTEELKLVKRIPSDSVVSAVSVVQGGDSLIVIAQKQLYAPVIVLKHDSAHDDYHFVQQLNPNSIPTGLGVFYVGQAGISDAYLGVTTSDDLFYLYKFSHIEGFKPVMQTELKGAQGFSSFFVGPRQYLLITSSSSPSVFEIVKQS